MSRLTVYGGGGSGLPSGGTVGQALMRDASGNAAWVTPYGPHVPAVGAALATSANVEANTLGTLAYSGSFVLAPIYLPVAMAFSQLGVNVTTAGAAGTTARLGFYTYVPHATTETLIYDAGTVAVDVTGFRGIAVAGNTPSLGPGYLGVAVGLSAGATLTAFALLWGEVAPTSAANPYPVKDLATAVTGPFAATVTGLANKNYAAPWVEMTRGA